mmetsp:Transcript_44324/g.138626  ORF Transcript_44324/g.138626 Transcript_44324/m.138626 type:complete len:307 (+) Transcript_44324:45-965(+)
MTLSRSQLEQIRADAGADAVPIDFAKMASWSEVEAAAFFESGGDIVDDHGPPPALQMVMDDLAMRFVVNCPAEEQESFERLLFQVEAAFWFYDDEYREIWPHSFPCFTLLQFAQKLFEMCELLKPFAARTSELYEKFRQYKIQIPTCGAMLLDQSQTKVLLVLGHKSKSWGFPKGKIDRDESHVACAVREVLEEVGYDISQDIDPSVYIERQHKGLPLTRLYLARNVPADTLFQTRTKKEIDEIQWHKIAALPTSKEAACAAADKKPFWMVAPYVLWLKQQLAAERKAKKKGGGKKQTAAAAATWP